MTLSCLLAAVLLSMTTLGAQTTITGSGQVKEESRSLSGFDAIAVSDGIDVYLTVGGNTAVKVIADDNLLPQLKTTVKGGVLTMEVDGNIRKSTKMEVHVTMPKVKAIDASGGSDVMGQGTINADDFRLGLSGGSDVKLALKAKSINCQISGGADAILSGEVGDLTVDASGGSDLKAGDLKATNCTLNTSGGSDATVYVTNSLKADASGASDIRYKGDPKDVNSRASGAADISKM